MTAKEGSRCQSNASTPQRLNEPTTENQPPAIICHSPSANLLMNDHERTWLESVLTSDIPLGQAMALRVVRLDENGLSLKLPLAPNINDKGTVFGGAMASAMILAGWSLPRLLMRREHIEADLVIGRCEIRFLLPVKTGFDVACDWPDKVACDQFISDLRNKGRGRLQLEPRVLVDGEVAARLSARYAALGRDQA
jgi:thioesterase domain-containing protein